MSNLITPSGYKPLISLQQTELAIARLKDFFQANLSAELRLRRVTAPLFVLQGTGLNDDLNGVERAVGFPIRDMGGARAEVVHSLAKWKRVTLADYGIEPGYGIYTDMNAIRADEELDNIHSLYVDQWDWERVMTPGERHIDFLKAVVRRIYGVLLRTEYLVWESFPEMRPCLPPDITFVHAEELRRQFPHLGPKEREHEIARRHRAVFIIGIGAALGDGRPHDGRAPDYDDWTSPGDDGLPGLNGDILLWHPVLGIPLEVSSMGIRVDKDALLRQLELTGQQGRRELYFHRRLLEGSLPLSIGGGIGQSRLCMFFLRKAHIGEVQASIWPDDMRRACAAAGIPLI